MIAVAIYAFGGIRTVGVLLGSQHAAFEAEIVPASRALRVESRSGRRWRRRKEGRERTATAGIRR